MTFPLPVAILNADGPPDVSPPAVAVILKTNRLPDVSPAAAAVVLLNANRPTPAVVISKQRIVLHNQQQNQSIGATL